MKILFVLFASAYDEFIYKKRYLGNTIFSMVLFCIIFLILMLGLNVLSGEVSAFNFGNSKGALVVSYYAWTMMLSVYTSTGYIVIQNKTAGTLENTAVNCRQYVLFLISKSIVSSAIYFLFSWLIIGALSWICHVKIYFRVLDVFPVLMVGLLSVLGLSLIIAGCGLIFRNIDGIMSILQFLLLGGLFLPNSGIVRMLVPFYSANKIISDIFLLDCSLKNFTSIDWFPFLLNAFIYTVIGVCIFQYCMKFAKRNGTLSFY